VTTPTAAELTLAIRDLALVAGAAIMTIYEGPFETRTKADASPVTDADEAAERLILEGLAKLTPDIPVIAEESVAAGHVPDVSGGRFWLVDPLDGTKEFVNRNGEFTVNIALVEETAPVLGVVHCPARDVTYTAEGPGRVFREPNGGASEPIRVRAPRPDGLVAAISRSHRDARTDAYLADYEIAETIVAGSSLKFCLVAAGEADIYPRIGPTHEWDTAAGHAVLAAAGGSVRTLDGSELSYGKPDFLNPDYVALGLDG
jgi:3'(2'), 5'-bisphosphate nucleotidase